MTLIYICNLNQERSWSYGTGSWIYNYMYNQCLSPLRLWVWAPSIGEVYSIQYYVIKFVGDKYDNGHVCGFLWILQFLPPIKIDRHDITEILLEVALSTINQTWIGKYIIHLYVSSGLSTNFQTGLWYEKLK